MYKKVDLQQGSDAWRNWRDGVITATAAATIMGMGYVDKKAEPSEYSPIYLLWAEKTGLIQKDHSENIAMAHGTNTEEKAREAFIESTGVHVVPMCVESNQYPFLAASLDGINEKLKIGLEIKCPKYYASFRKQKEGLPSYYYAQVQHQMLCTDYERWFYWSYFNNSEILHEVPRDEKFQEELVRRCQHFQTSVNNKTVPDEKYFLPYCGNL